MIHRNSTLLQTINFGDIYIKTYRNTPVLYWNKDSDEITFRTGGWNTICTARAMNFALEDIGMTNAYVCKKGDSLFIKNSYSQSVLYKIDNELTLMFTELDYLIKEGWNAN